MARYYSDILRITSSGIPFILRNIVILGIIVYIACMGIILSYSHTNVNYDEDVVIVLGAGVVNGKVSKTLQSRLDASIDYYYKNKDIHIVVTGGLTRQKDTTEAAAMKEYLVSHGIPENIIIVEDKSQSTIENYKFTKEILEKQNIKHDSIAFVTNSFHIYRAKKYSEFCGFKNSHALSTKTDLFVFVPALIREVLGVIDMWLFKLH